MYVIFIVCTNEKLLFRCFVIFFLLVNKKMSTKNTKIRPSVYFMLDGMWDITQKQGHIDCFYRIVQFPPPHQTNSHQFLRKNPILCQSAGKPIACCCHSGFASTKFLSRYGHDVFGFIVIKEEDINNDNENIFEVELIGKTCSNPGVSNFLTAECFFINVLFQRRTWCAHTFLSSVSATAKLWNRK